MAYGAAEETRNDSGSTVSQPRGDADLPECKLTIAPLFMHTRYRGSMTKAATATKAPPPEMVGPVSAGDRRSKLRLAETWKLLKPYWVSKEGRAGLALLALVVALNLALVAANVWFTNWNRVFYNALENRDFDAFKHQLLLFCMIAAVFIIIAILKQYYTMMLQMRWRTWLTSSFLTNWLDGQAYYRIEQSHSTDNPDQRIAEDLRTLASDSLTLSLGLLNSVVTLSSFITLLWVISGAAHFTLAGVAISIPGYMVWFAVLYAVVGSWITHKVGKPLIGLSFQQEQREADFRYTMMRLRENAEGVALYGGEPTEKASLLARFEFIRDNWRWLMIYTRRLVFVNSGYGQFAIVFPLLVAAPRYFAKEITLGGLMQISSAFGQVQGALSWLVDSYASLVNWQAASNRVLDFQQAVKQAEDERAACDGVRGIQIQNRSDAASGNAIVATDLAMGLPGTRANQPLTEPFSLNIERGQRWLVTGPSGSGKSVFFRAMAGIWPYGKGSIARPAQARILFLPQKSYVPSGTLADALCYPAAGDSFSAEELRELLRACNLEALSERLDDIDNWAMRLSPGEQQRLAFARALLQRPDFLFLDEATSALDEETEALMYQLVCDRLPDAAVISIAHRSTVARWHELAMRYLPQGLGKPSLIQTGVLPPASPARA